MKKLFLTSSIGSVAADIAKRLGATGKKLCFIITASELEKDDLDWRHADREALVTAGFVVTDYTITDKTAAQISLDLAEYYLLCMEGGDTFYLLGKIQESGCADVLRAFAAEKPYIGSSAGSIVAGPDIYPVRHLESYLPVLASYQGLGLTDLVIFPHWGSDYFKKDYFESRLAHNYNSDHKLVLLTDNQYLIVENSAYQFIDVTKS